MQTAIKHYPLTTNQSEMFQEWEEDTRMTQFNICGYYLIEGHPLIAKRMRDVFKMIIESHPVFRMRLLHVGEQEVAPLKHYDDPTRLIRQYPDYSQDITMTFQTMSDEQLDSHIKKPLKPFDPFGEPLLRAEFIETPSRQYLCFEFFHLLADGLTYQSFVNDIKAAYAGMDLKPQSLEFFEYAEQQYQWWDTEEYFRLQHFYESKYADGLSFTRLPESHGENYPWGELLQESHVVDKDRIEDYCERHDLSVASVMMAVYGWALSKASGESTVAFLTGYHGRGKGNIDKALYGNYMKEIVIRLNITDTISLQSLTKQMEREMMEGIRHSDYPIDHYLHTHLSDEDYDCTECLFNSSYLDMTTSMGDIKVSAHIKTTGMTSIPLILTIHRFDDKYVLEAQGSGGRYSRRQLRGFLQLYADIIGKEMV